MASDTSLAIMPSLCPSLFDGDGHVQASLLGHLAEVVTGQAYQDLMSTLVFAPLRMHRTTFDPTLAMSFPLSQSHRLTSDGDVHVMRPFADNANPVLQACK